MPFKVPSSFEIPSAVQRAFQVVGDNLNTLTTKVDKNYFKCTSTTRPASPTSGDQIYETNTLRTLVHDGTGWIIQSEPPVTWAYPFTAGLTQGNGFWSGVYQRNDGWCDIEAYFEFGSTSAVTAPVFLNLPINGSANRPFIPDTLNVAYWDISAGDVAKGMFGAGNNPVLLVLELSLAYPRVSNLGAVTPFTWASGDRISISGRYRMTTRYS